MKALTYQVNPVGWATCKWLRHFWGSCLLSPLNGVHLREIEKPTFPADDWVLVRTLMGGICGTDLAIIAQKQPPNSILQAFSSFPAVLGHENVAVVEEVGPSADRSWVGRRVCVEPTLCCKVRGIDPPCPRCQSGQYGACENFAAGGGGKSKLPPGSSIGYNSRTGGSFGEYFVAHQSQLVEVPEDLSDEQGVLTDPVACSLHAALRADLADAKQVLVYGTGVLGLGVIAALRAIGYAGRIDALDRYAYLADCAGSLGADCMLNLPGTTRERFEEIASRTGATVQRARFGNYMLSGGYDVVFDMVGSAASLSESMKWTRARGQVLVVGTGHGGWVDITPIWFRELKVVGAYGRQVEDFGGRKIDTYRVVHEMMREGKLKVEELLTHTFRLGEYKKALRIGLNKARNRAIKIAFDFR